MRKTSNSYYPIVFKIKNHTDQFEIAVDILNPVFRSQIFFYEFHERAFYHSFFFK